VITDADIRALTEIVGDENVSTRKADLVAHSLDESFATPAEAEVIVWPSSTEQVAAVLRYANAQRLPVAPWAGGSSLEGNPIPVRGGILLAMYRMNQVLEIREEDLQVVVQPGVVYAELNKTLRRLGLFFPPAPGSSDVATIGGMVANNSSGMRAVRYGVTRDYIMKLKVVLADGRVVDVGSAAKKSTSGYDLVRLFVGSEGTLGIVTEVTMKLAGLPEHVAVAVAAFGSLDDASGAVFEAVRYGLEPSAIEIMDAATVRATNLQCGLSLQVVPTLFVEFHGSEAFIADQMAYVREICEDNGCTSFELADTPEERSKLWAARREAHDSIKLSFPGCTMVAGDVCVPVSQFAEMIRFSHELGQEMDLHVHCFGHAGDGNLHSEIIGYRDDPEQFARAQEATARIIDYGIDLGGTIAGEHGIGLLKRKFMIHEFGAEGVGLMREIKALFDPNNILNPGKIFPDEMV